jgi:hypothetical protein
MHSSFELHILDLSQTLEASWRRHQDAHAAQQGSQQGSFSHELWMHMGLHTGVPMGSFEQGLAFQHLGWAWADGAGAAEWEPAFLSMLQQTGLVVAFFDWLKLQKD